jgi:carnitine O-acetyltransferase
MSSLSTTRPPVWKTVAPAPPQGTLTFAAQPSLPKLPVPELPDTLTRLKESLKPLAINPEEYSTAVSKIDEFGQGAGKELQQRLLNRHAGTEHWLEEWWDNVAYLGYRDSVSMLPSVISRRLFYMMRPTGRRECIILLQVTNPYVIRFH